jgi:hypothetical protein
MREDGRASSVFLMFTDASSVLKSVSELKILGGDCYDLEKESKFG